MGRTASNVGSASHRPKYKKFPGWGGKKIISFAFNYIGELINSIFAISLIPVIVAASFINRYWNSLLSDLPVLIENHVI